MRHNFTHIVDMRPVFPASGHVLRHSLPLQTRFIGTSSYILVYENAWGPAMKTSMATCWRRAVMLHKIACGRR